MKKFVLMIAVLCLWTMPDDVGADVVVLKNGQTFEGKVIAQTDIYIRLKPAQGTISMKEFLVESVKGIIFEDPVSGEMQAGSGSDKSSSSQTLSPKRTSFKGKDPYKTLLSELGELRGTASTGSGPEVWTNEMFQKMNLETATQTPEFEGGPQSTKESLQRVQQMMLAEQQRQGGDVSVYNMTPESLNALTSEMENGLELTLRKQLGWIFLFFSGSILGFILVAGLIAFFINRAIDMEIAGEGPKAGLWRRLAAMVIDLSIGSVIIGAVLALPGLLIPMDAPAARPLYLLAVIVGGIYGFYLIFGYVKWTNTYGRYVMNLKIVAMDTGEKPAYSQAFKRSMTLILLPIEIMLLIISKSKRRIGDAWAGTMVKVVTSEKKWLERAKIGIAIIVLGNLILFAVAPAAANKMYITQAARNHIEKETKFKIKDRPQNVNIQATPGLVQGEVTFALQNSGGKSIVLLLVHQENRWVVRDSRFIKKKYFGLITMTY